MKKYLAILALITSTYASANTFYCPPHITCGKEGCTLIPTNFTGSIASGDYSFYMATVAILTNQKMTCTYRGAEGQLLTITSVKDSKPDFTIPWSQWFIKGTDYNCQGYAYNCPLKD